MGEVQDGWLDLEDNLAAKEWDKIAWMSVRVEF